MTLINTSDLQERRESALIDKGRQDPQRLNPLRACSTPLRSALVRTTLTCMDVSANGLGKVP
ncbi:hypothetical protein [Streptomyces phaeochromogenes]